MAILLDTERAEAVLLALENKFICHECNEEASKEEAFDDETCWRCQQAIDAYHSARQAEAQWQAEQRWMLQEQISHAEHYNNDWP